MDRQSFAHGVTLLDGGSGKSGTADYGGPLVSYADMEQAQPPPPPPQQPPPPPATALVSPSALVENDANTESFRWELPLHCGQSASSSLRLMGRSRSKVLLHVWQ